LRRRMARETPFCDCLRETCALNKPRLTAASRFAHGFEFDTASKLLGIQPPAHRSALRFRMNAADVRVLSFNLSLVRTGPTAPTCTLETKLG